ncbi:MAG: EscU/YscU/HrcU family type III secretion system export apparatus switch protein [Thermodesulfobacteriota bacterium]
MRPPRGSTPKPARTRSMAVALGYDRLLHRAPRIVAKGEGELARRIVELARAHGIPLREDPALVRLLSNLEVDQEIPPVLYQAVAEVLAFVYRLGGKR